MLKESKTRGLQFLMLSLHAFYWSVSYPTLISTTTAPGMANSNRCTVSNSQHLPMQPNTESGRISLTPGVSMGTMIMLCCLYLHQDRKYILWLIFSLLSVLFPHFFIFYPQFSSCIHVDIYFCILQPSCLHAVVWHMHGPPNIPLPPNIP